MMKYYEQLLELGCFSRDDIVSLTGNYDTAGTLIRNYINKQYIAQVKRNLYVAINLADKQPVVSKFGIARKITPTAYVSHHAAFEYHGCANQVSYHVQVSSETPFAAFEFDDITYTYLASRISEGIVVKPDGVRVTDYERTIVDGINDFQKVMGLEELLRCIELIPSIKEELLLSYLTRYNKQILYQKTGYVLRYYQKMFNLSEAFFNECAAHIGKSTRYFSNEQTGNYIDEWQLIAPPDLSAITGKGISDDADI